MLAACGPRGGKGVGRPRRMQRAGESPNGDRWGSARVERTLNMLLMSVTLDVLRLSGWLNADAPCSVEGRIVDQRIQRQGYGKACSRSSRGVSGWVEVSGMPGAHRKHEAHVCDAGRFPA